MKPILLIQARDEEHMLAQERQCFLDRCELDSGNLISVNAVREPVETLELANYSAVMIGGSGAYSAVENYDWIKPLLSLVGVCIENAVPMFGSCWGHQVIARAAGGKVVHDARKSEMGCVSIRVTQAGAADDLFSTLPPVFPANAGHHDRVEVLPPGAIELADNASQSNQAFRLGGLPIFGTQFHSELDAKAERERLVEYRDHYREDLPSDESFENVLANLMPTTEVDKLMRHFLDVFVRTP